MVTQLRLGGDPAVPGMSKLQRSRRGRLMIAAGAALAIAGAGITSPTIAAVDPGHVVLVSKDDSIVIAEGFLLGDPVLVQVRRNGVVIGQAEGVAEDLLGDGVGRFEVNHAADPTVCWTGVTPEILAGDVVRVVSGNDPVVITDEVTVADIEVTQGPTMTGPGVGTVKGHVNGTPPPIDQLSVETRGLGSPRFRGFAPGESDGVTGTIAYDTGAGAVPGSFTATFSGLNEQQSSVFLDSFEVAATLLAEENEGTVAVFEAVAGSEDPACPAVARRAVTSLSKNVVNLANMSTPLAVSGVSADATAVNVTLSDGTNSVTRPAVISGTGISQTWTTSFSPEEVNSLSDGTLTASGAYTETAGELTGVEKTLGKDVVAPGSPGIAPNGGNFVGSQTVSLSTGDALAKYTLDGSTPSASNGTTYRSAFVVTRTVTVKAVAIDAAGNVGPVSEASFRKATVPLAPRNVAASSGAAGGTSTASVRWTIPASSGGAAITRYVVTALRLSPQGTVQSQTNFMAPSTSRAMTLRLAAGPYRFRVRAVNAVGTGPYSAISNRVTAQ